MVWYFILKSFCYLIISWKRFVNSFFSTSINNEEEVTYFDNIGNVLTNSNSIEDYDFKQKVFLTKMYNKKCSQIVRSSQDLNKKMNKCNFDFCIFYVETPTTEYKLDINSYFIEGNIFDETFLFCLLKSQHPIDLIKEKEKTKDIEINWMFIDHEMHISVLPSKCKIILEKNSYQTLL